MNIKSIIEIKLFKIIIKNVYNIIFIILLLLIIWLIYFLYQNLYQVIIIPKPIQNIELQAKQAKINLNLYNGVTQKLDQKKQTKIEDLSGVGNHFVSF